MTALGDMAREMTQLRVDANRWRAFACNQTALMLGSKLDPNDATVDWLQECNRLADAIITKQA